KAEVNVVMADAFGMRICRRCLLRNRWASGRFRLWPNGQPVLLARGLGLLRKGTAMFAAQRAGRKTGRKERFGWTRGASEFGPIISSYSETAGNRAWRSKCPFIPGPTLQFNDVLRYRGAQYPL